MRICHVSDVYLPRLGGIELQVSDLAYRQQESGHEVAVITATPPPDEEGPVAPVPVHRLTTALPLGDYRPRLPPVEGTLRPLRAPALRRRLRALEPDAVHVHVAVMSPLAFTAIAVSRRLGLPTVVTLHSMWDYAAPLFWLLAGLTGWTRWPLVLTAVSDVAAAPVRRLVGPSVPVTVLPNGVEPEQWRVEPVDRDPRDVLVVSTMRLTLRKRPLALLGMLKDARGALPPDVRLRAVIIGDGPSRPDCERFVARHGMQDDVDLVGRLSRAQIRELYRRADLYVAPADLESFGIAAVEARCAGLPVLAKEHSGIRDVVDDGLGGVLVGSDAEMTDALVALARDPGLRARMAAHNRAATPPTDWDAVLVRADAAYDTARMRVDRHPLVVLP